MAVSHLLLVSINGRRREVKLTWGHWLPRLLRSGAITISGRRILFKRSPFGPVRVAPILIAHEIVHVAQVAAWGLVGYYRRAFWQWLTIRIHDERPIEIAANMAQTRVLLGTHPTIRILSPIPGA